MKKNHKKNFIVDYVKTVKNLSRQDELQNSCGWAQKDKVTKDKKQYTRKTKHSLNYYEQF